MQPHSTHAIPTPTIRPPTHPVAHKLRTLGAQLSVAIKHSKQVRLWSRDQ